MSLVKIHWHPTRRELKQFAAIWFPLFFAIVGWLVWRRLGAWNAAVAIWIVVAVLSPLMWFLPRLARAVFVGWMCVTFPIGYVVSHILLAVVYFGIVTPIGLIMRLAGRDALGLKIDPNATTYWVPHAMPKDSRRYFRQF